MVRYTDTEMTVMNKVYTHRSLETRGIESHTDHMRKNQDKANGRENDRKIWTRAFIVVYAGRNRQGRVTRFRIVWFNCLV